MGRPQDEYRYHPRLMQTERAAAYVDSSKTKFLEGVESGHWPPPVNDAGQPKWDVRDLDARIDELKRYQKRKAVNSGKRSLADLLEAEEEGGQGGPAVRQ